MPAFSLSRKKLVTIVLAFLVTVVWTFFSLRYVNYPTSPNRLLFLKCLVVFYALCAFILVFLPLPSKLKKWARYALPVVIPPFLGISLELITIDTGYTLGNAYFFNVLLFYAIELICILLSCSITFGSLIGASLVVVVYIVNYFVYEFRHVPFTYNDLFAIATVKQVVANYKFVPGSLVMFSLTKYLLVLVALLKTRQKKTIPLRLRLTSVLAGVLVFAIGWFSFVNLAFWEKQGFRTVQGFTSPYHYDGFLVYSCITLASEKATAPDGYSEEAARSILDSYSSQSTESSASADRPHVIIIMNESLFDPYTWGNIELEGNPLTFFNSLTQDTIRGYLNSSVLGGSTCNAEFEVFTGHSMKFFPNGFYPYLQSINNSTPSLVSLAGDVGYSTYSIHPELSTNWNRHLVYNHLGFDQQFWIQEFVYADTLGNGVSDASTFDKVIDIFENRETDEKLFVFDLTIQNHGGYTWTEIEQTVTTPTFESKEFNNYLSLVDKTDEAFEDLVTYFSTQDEKVIICMFGDHQPLFTLDETYNIVCEQTEGLSDADQLLNLYKTPFVIWANYDIPEESDLDISMNYLGLLLAKTADIPLSPYMHFLEDLQKQYPIISTNGFVDAEGNFYTSDYSDQWIRDYSFVQYYILNKDK